MWTEGGILVNFACLWHFLLPPMIGLGILFCILTSNPWSSCHSRSTKEIPKQQTKLNSSSFSILLPVYEKIMCSNMNFGELSEIDLSTNWQVRCTVQT